MILPGLESVKHEVDHGELDHRYAALRIGLVVFAQPPISAEPGERAFDDPAFGQHHEPLHVVATFDDFDVSAKTLGDPRERFAAEPTVGPDQLQAMKHPFHFNEQVFAAVAFGGVRSKHEYAEGQAERVDTQKTLSTKGFLARVVAVATVLEGASVLTLWLSMMPTLGVVFLPAWRRTCSRSLSWRRCQVPSIRKRR